MANQTISFKKIEINKLQFMHLCNYFIEVPFSEENKEGFVIQDQDYNSVFVYYILRLPTYETQFDITTNQIVRQETFKTKIIPFSINYKMKTLEIYGGKKNIPRLIQIVSKVLNYEVVIEEIVIEPKKMIRNMIMLQGLDFEVLNIHVKDFEISQYILGDCNLKVSGLFGAQELIEKYSDKISQIKLSILYQDIATFVVVNRSGSIRFYGDSTKIAEQFMDKLKGILLGD